MPPPIPSGTEPSFLVDGLDRPTLRTSLQSLEVSWPSTRKAILRAIFNNWGSDDSGPPGFLWSDGRILRTGAKLAVRFGADTAFSGTVVAVETQLASGAAPMFAIRAEGRTPGKTAGPSRPLNWGSDLLRFDATVERSGLTPTTGHVNAEAVSGSALGTGALRPGMPIDVLGVGPMFEGPYKLTTVSLHFDLALGLRAEFAAQRWLQHTMVPASN